MHLWSRDRERAESKRHVRGSLAEIEVEKGTDCGAIVVQGAERDMDRKTRRQVAMGRVGCIVVVVVEDIARCKA